MMTSKLLYEYSPPRVFAKAFDKVAAKLGLRISNPKEVEYIVSETPRPELGDFGAPVARYLAGLGEESGMFVEELKANLYNYDIVKEVIFKGGYVNIRLDESKVAEYVFSAVARERESYGIVKTDKPLRIIVEHTSANPVHPLHIGHARNASIGDSLARMLTARGHKVQRRFYINDLGRQVAVLIYAIMRARLEPPPGEKIDHWLGRVYAIAHTLIDLAKVRRELEELKKAEKLEEYRLKLRELDELTAVLSELRERDPGLFDRIAEALPLSENHDEQISKLMKEYELGVNEELKKLVRKIVGLCLEGFKETLSKLGVEFDVWDWESDLAWSSLVNRVLREAKNSPYFTMHKGTFALDFTSLLESEDVRNLIGSSAKEVPPLILTRSDGTTLYTTRDIAYTIKKFEEFKADMVINVIGAEQKLEQLQLKLALLALGYKDYATRLHHYMYEMVLLPGMAMSSRRGRLLSLDELLERAIAKAKLEVEKRGKDLGIERVEEVAKAIGVGALRYSLVSTAAQKPIEFNLDEALDFNRNSAPYIQYTYVRAHNILAKYGKPIDWSSIEYKAASDENRRKILLILYQFPYFFVKAVDELRPEILVSYANRLADRFNSWYPIDPVIKEKDPGIRGFKLALVYTTKIVLANIMKLLGIPILERM